jgi:hypothetical protein
MRKLLLTTVVFGLVAAARTSPARGDVGLGLFLGEPTAIDLKIGLDHRSALDLAFGYTTFDRGEGYGHLTYLVTPVVAQGDALSVPLRLGIGGALFGTRHDLDLAVRAPVELGLRLRRTPLEFFLDVALDLVFVNPRNDLHVDVQVGGGFRVYF